MYTLADDIVDILEPSHKLDALIAEHVMGFTIVGEACRIYVEGEWSVHIDSSDEGWACFSDMGPIYTTCRVDHTKEPVDEDEPAYRREDDAGAIKRFGHPSHCLNAVPDYSQSFDETLSPLTRLRDNGWEVAVTFLPTTWEGPRSAVTITSSDGTVSVGRATDSVTAFCRAESSAIAFCRAALKAVFADQRTFPVWGEGCVPIPWRLILQRSEKFLCILEKAPWEYVSASEEPRKTSVADLLHVFGSALVEGRTAVEQLNELVTAAIEGT